MKLGWTALLNILRGAELRLWAWKRQRSRFRLASVGLGHVALWPGAKLPGRRWGAGGVTAICLCVQTFSGVN